jgi:hypothetical protein
MSRASYSIQAIAGRQSAAQFGKNRARRRQGGGAPATGRESMTDVEKLLAIEEIKRLKSRYFWGLDHKDWDFWRREVWAADARLIVPEDSRDCVGIEAIIGYVTESTADQVSVHHGHMPDIEITSDTTAKGLWAMEDRLYRTKEHPLGDGSTYLHGFGHYHETYVRTAAGWRLETTKLTRLRVEAHKIY